MKHRHIWHSLNYEAMRIVASAKREKYDEHPTGFHLYQHVFPDGLVYREVVYAERATNVGPLFFLALSERGQVVEKSMWSQEAIALASGASDRPPAFAGVSGSPEPLKIGREAIL